MATTPVYGWPTPKLGGPPNGPEAFTELAEAIEADVERIETDIAALAFAPGWHRVANGSGSGTSVDVDLTGGGAFPAGTFDTIRIRATGFLSVTDNVAAQINGQTGSNYRRRYTIIDLTNTPGFAGGTGGDTSTSWLLAEWDTLARGSLTFEMYRCSDNVAVPYYATGVRIDGDGFWSVAGGRYNSQIIPSSVLFFCGTATFGEFSWELEGYIR